MKKIEKMDTVLVGTLAGICIVGLIRFAAVLIDVFLIKIGIAFNLIIIFSVWAGMIIVLLAGFKIIIGFKKSSG